MLPGGTRGECARSLRVRWGLQVTASGFAGRSVVVRTSRSRPRVAPGSDLCAPSRSRYRTSRRGRRSRGAGPWADAAPSLRHAIFVTEGDRFGFAAR